MTTGRTRTTTVLPCFCAMRLCCGSAGGSARQHFNTSSILKAPDLNLTKTMPASVSRSPFPFLSFPFSPWVTPAWRTVHGELPPPGHSLPLPSAGMLGGGGSAVDPIRHCRRPVVLWHRHPGPRFPTTHASPRLHQSDSVKSCIS